MRIRQLVLVSEDRDRVVKELKSVFKIEVAFYDPGIIHFGLENAVLPVGDSFLEVISPVKADTTAGRYLEKRKGEGGYMVIVQTDNFLKEKERVKSEGIRIVWEANREDEGVHARAIHLHPRDIGGAILSLDSMEPKESWLWAGKDWQQKRNEETVSLLNGVHIQSDNPETTMKKWEKALGIRGKYKDNKHQLDLVNSRVIFTQDLDGRGEGAEAFEIKVKDKSSIIQSAEELNLLKNRDVYISGVKFLIN